MWLFLAIIFGIPLGLLAFMVLMIILELIIDTFFG